MARIVYQQDSANLNATKSVDECMGSVENEQVTHLLQPRQTGNTGAPLTCMFAPFMDRSKDLHDLFYLYVRNVDYAVRLLFLGAAIVRYSETSIRHKSKGKSESPVPALAPVEKKIICKHANVDR